MKFHFINCMVIGGIIAIGLFLFLNYIFHLYILPARIADIVFIGLLCFISLGKLIFEFKKNNFS